MKLCATLKLRNTKSYLRFIVFQNHILAGENASFEIQLEDKAEKITWLKDNKPLDDRLADRITAKELAGNYYRLDIKHCR